MKHYGHRKSMFNFLGVVSVDHGAGILCIVIIGVSCLITSHPPSRLSIGLEWSSGAVNGANFTQECRFYLFILCRLTIYRISNDCFCGIEEKWFFTLHSTKFDVLIDEYR